ncbi:MAG: lamin tail domain-containing protein, partial [Verrucomicrobiales bacterium]
IYTYTLTATDGDAVQASISRDASVFSDAGWSSFGEPILEDYWTMDNIEVRDGDSPIASYTLDDRPGKLLLKIEDELARPLTMSAPTHPAIWRPLPPSTDWSLQSDVELDTLQQGDFNVGAIVELDENGTTTRYSFGIEDGDFLRVKRSSGGSFSQLASLTWVDDVATVRIRRFGNQLLFEHEGEPGEWINVHVRAIPGATTATKGGIFASTGTAQNARFEFDYVMLIDPNLSNEYLAGLRITEIMYNNVPGSAVEYIELTNTGSVPIDLAGVSFDAGSPFDAYVLPSYVLQPGASAVITNDAAAFVALYGNGPDIIGEWPGGQLSNGGESVVMRDPDGNVIHDFSYDDSGAWPGAADGDSFSLQIVDTEGDYNDPSNWTSSDGSGGSPGVYEFGLAWHSFVQAGGSGSVTLEWQSHPLRTYTVEASDDLDGWEPLATVPASGSGITGYVDTTPGPGQRFYRIKIAP